VLPSNRDERRGEFGISAIPGHITRKGRRSRLTDDQWHPWLRVHLSGGHQDSVVLTKKQVTALRDALNDWLERTHV
jgi:hypothetical protein